MDIRTATIHIEQRWAMRPVVVLACPSYADEHWQIWHPHDYGQPDAMPAFVLVDGELQAHPDTPHR